MPETATARPGITLYASLLSKGILLWGRALGWHAYTMLVMEEGSDGGGPRPHGERGSGQPMPAPTSGATPTSTNERGRLERAVLVTAGLFSVGLGVAGVFLPLLPATPFFLLAGWCFAKGSRRFERWLQNRKWYQDYAARFADGRGVPPHVKAITILVLWAGIAASALFMVPGILPRCGLIVVGVAVTVHIITIRPKGKMRGPVSTASVTDDEVGR